MTFTKGMISSKRHNYETPQDLFDSLNAEFHFTLDPCATDKNAKCKRYFTYHDNGLNKSWENEIVFMNPPYGKEIKYWIAKAFLESKKGITVVCLVPARTDTSWWHDIVMRGEIRFIRGRLKFKGMKYNAPYPSAIVIFRPPSAGPGS